MCCLMNINYGPLTSLLSSDDMTEIMINSWDHVFVEHKGLIVRTAIKFLDDREFNELIYNILLIDKKDLTDQYCFDGILPEGHRYHITLPPLSPKGPTLTIRKFSEKVFSLEQFAKNGFLSDKAVRFLQIAIISRLNIIVSGGTGTGKTSLLNTLCSLIPEDQRIVSIEDTQELKAQHSNWVHLVTHKKSKTEISARDCLHNALRMRPDRIVVGECRGSEAFEMLQAMNTGHDGSLTSIHANSANDCLSRLETLVSIAHPDLPIKIIRHQMSEAIDLIIQLKRTPEGHRVVSDIIEITGIEGDTLTRSVVFSRNKAGLLDVNGLVPDILNKINLNSKLISAQFFDPQTQIKKTS
ncbi:MAG: CpaF family protein [Pseudobdellovibrio sp.]